MVSGHTDESARVWLTHLWLETEDSDWGSWHHHAPTCITIITQRNIKLNQWSTILVQMTTLFFSKILRNILLFLENEWGYTKLIIANNRDILFLSKMFSFLQHLSRFFEGKAPRYLQMINVLLVKTIQILLYLDYCKWKQSIDLFFISYLADKSLVGKWRWLIIPGRESSE